MEYCNNYFNIMSWNLLEKITGNHFSNCTYELCVCVCVGRCHVHFDIHDKSFYCHTTFVVALLFLLLPVPLWIMTSYNNHNNTFNELNPWIEWQQHTVYGWSNNIHNESNDEWAKKGEREKERGSNRERKQNYNRQYNINAFNRGERVINR